MIEADDRAETTFTEKSNGTSPMKTKRNRDIVEEPRPSSRGFFDPGRKGLHFDPLAMRFQPP